MKRFWTTLGIILTAVAALYFAAAGWVRVDVETRIKQTAEAASSGPVQLEGVTFASGLDRDRYVAVRDAQAYFPWTLKLPHPVSLLITAMAFGFLGGLLRIVFNLAHSPSSFEKPFVNLAFSSLMGLVALGISFSIPAALTTSEVTLSPVVLLFLCLLSGAFSKHLILWLEEQFKKMFQRYEEPPKS
jgi:hypothetical protein